MRSSATAPLLLLSALASAMHASTLYDIPVSNHGARVRYLLYKKGLENAVQIQSPGKLGGLKSAEYTALNPQGKMPLLVDDEFAVWEADAICRHILDKHPTGPSFQPSTLEARSTSEMLCRLHDAYIGPVQGAMYRAPPGVFGKFISRRAAIDELVEQLGVAESLAHPTGPYLTGPDVSLADATLMPTMVFFLHMLPKYTESATAPTAEPLDAAAGALGPRLLRWWVHMSQNDAEAMRVIDEIKGGLNKWDEQGRWDTLLGAGMRDQEPPTIFDNILSGEIPSEIVYEDDVAIAFKDIAPAAPTHCLVIPRRRDGLSGLGAATGEHAGVLGHLMVVAAQVAKEQGLEDFRVVTNCGPSAGQTVPHIHLHVIGGRDLTWPPG